MKRKRRLGHDVGTTFGGAMLTLLAACTAGMDPAITDDPAPPTEPTDDTGTPPEGHSGHTGGETEPLPPLPLLVVNELMTSNRSTVNASDLSLPDWVELLNADTEPIALARIQLRDEAQNLWMGTEADGVIEPGERRLIWLGSGTGEGTWTGFALSEEGDELVVIVDDRLLEIVEVPELGDDLSLARTPDATGELAPTAWPTPDAPNGEAVSPTLDPADATWFLTDVVHRVDFRFPQSTYDQLNEWERPEVHAGMEVDGVRYADVGLKLKGSASYQRMDGKPAFIVDLNEWVPGTRFRGLQAFKLHNGIVHDATRTHDHLTYRLAREAGLMAPRVAWTQVFVNGEDYGLYVVVEAHDDRFVAYHHPDQGETGVIMEPNETESGGWGGDFGQGHVLEWNMEEGPLPPDPLAIASLTAVDEILARRATDENVEELFLSMDEHLLHTYMAWESVVMHTDGYKVTNNWRVFVDGDTHLVSLVPSGAEMTWTSPVQAWFWVGRAARFCLENEGCEHDYAARLVEVADLADQLALDDDFVARSTFLDPAIQADPRYPFTGMVDGERDTTLFRIRENPEQSRATAYAQFPDLRP